MRITTLVALLAILPACLLLAQQPDPFAPADERPALRPRPQRVPDLTQRGPRRPETPRERPALQSVVLDKLNETTNLDPVEMQLKDLVDVIRDTHNMQIMLNAKKLDEAGVSIDTPITKRVAGVRLSTALDVILDELDLAYIVQDEIVMITTKEDAQSHLEIRVYDCRDLIAGHSGEHDERAHRLMRIITTNVEDRSWNMAAGTAGAENDRPDQGRGTISEYDGMIIVTQTAQVHRKIDQLLDMLRRVSSRRAVNEVIR